MEIFIKNLPYHATEQTLKEFLSKYGTIASVKIIKDRATGESRGFGFVEINFSKNAIDTIKELNTADFEGKKLQIKKSDGKR